MGAAVGLLGTGSRALSTVLGLLVLLLAGTVAATSLAVADVTAWALDIFGVTFLIIIATLVLTVIFAWLRMRQVPSAASRRTWLETGVHAANGIATVALTYTLLGISLGIAGLAGQELTPATIQGVIQGLTEHFSLAFMTTVVGLPTAALLRALMLITATRIEQDTAQPTRDGGAP